MNKLDNKGFTLVEVLAVLVILTVIMAIAIPNISSSLERSKDKQNEARLEVLESYAELYISDYKNNVNVDVTSCYITLDSLVDNGYASSDEIKDSDEDKFTGAIIYNKSDNSYKYQNSYSSYVACIG